MSLRWISFFDRRADLDGLEFLRRIRGDSDRANAYLTAVILAANTELRHDCEARDPGMTE